MDGLWAVYGHGVTKFSGMGRFTYPRCSASTTTTATDAAAATAIASATATAKNNNSIRR